MRFSLTFTRTRVITESIRRDVDLPDHLYNQGGEALVLTVASNSILPTTAATEEETGSQDWILSPEPPPIIRCVGAQKID